MSYILDALRRADAERTRGAVPGLHAQSVPVDAEPAARRFNPLLWAAGAAGMLAVAGGVMLVVAPWRTLPGPGSPPRDAVPTAPGETPAAASGAIAPAAEPVAPPFTALAPPAPRVPVYPPPPDAPPTRAAAVHLATPQPRLLAAAASSPAAAPAEHYGPPATPAAARPTAVVNINDLPPTLRAQLPRLAVGGAIYSDTPSARMVILNGQVFHEGDKPAPDTVLEQIRLKSAVLNYRGQRYEIAF